MQIISEPTVIPDQPRSKPTALNVFLTSNQNIYSNPILDSLLGFSDNCLITLQHYLISQQDTYLFMLKRFYIILKLIENHFTPFPPHALSILAFQWFLSLFATFATNSIQLTKDLSFPVPTNLA